MSEAAVRVTAAQNRAAMHVLERRTDFASLAELAAALAEAVVTADDATSRWVVIVRDGSALRAFGTYATADSARKVAETAGLASLPHARGAVLPLVRAPRNPATAEQIKPKRAKAAA